MVNIIRFARYFYCSWKNYPCYMCFAQKHFSKEQREEMEQSDRECGIEPYKGRFDYAWRSAKSFWAHRDRYGRKCRKFNADCKRCDAKHC